MRSKQVRDLSASMVVALVTVGAQAWAEDQPAQTRDPSHDGRGPDADESDDGELQPHDGELPPGSLQPRGADVPGLDRKG